jgi:hypothetical protein
VVLLRLRPRAGDTVRTRFEQSVKFVGRAGGAPAAADAPLAPSGAMVVYAHSVVERADAGGAEITAVTDSVALKASGAPAHATEASRRAMQGRRTRLRVAPDGSTTVLGAPGRRAGDAMRFPAALPDGPVAPGAMWARAMTVPWGAARAPGQPAAPHAASHAASTIDVWFRFDSLGRGGTLAFLSLRGTVRPPPGEATRRRRAASPDCSSSTWRAAGWSTRARPSSSTAPSPPRAGSRARCACSSRSGCACSERPVRVLRGAARG